MTAWRVLICLMFGHREADINHWRFSRHGNAVIIESQCLRCGQVGYWTRLASTKADGHP